MSLVAVLLVGAMPALARVPFWQHRGGAAPAPPPQTAPAPPQRMAPQQGTSTPPSYKLQLNGPGPHRGDWLRKYMALPPHQQEQQLQNDPSFRSLSPDKQNHLLDRLRKFNSQPPEKKAQILNRMETFEHMTPEQQQSARQSILTGTAICRTIRRTRCHRLTAGCAACRPRRANELLNSDEYRNNFTDDAARPVARHGRPERRSALTMVNRQRPAALPVRNHLTFTVGSDCGSKCAPRQAASYL